MPAVNPLQTLHQLATRADQLTRLATDLAIEAAAIRDHINDLQVTTDLAALLGEQSVLHQQ